MGKEVRYTDPSRQSDLPPYDDKAAAEYVHDLQPMQERRKRTKRKRIFAVVLALFVVAAAGYYLFLRPEDQTDQKPAQNTTIPQEQTQQVAEKKEYTSESMNLSFSYPGDWKVDDTSQDLISVETPVVKLTDLNGDQADAKAVLTFLTSGSEVPGYDEISAVAVQDSEKLVYTKPSQNQRAETFLSFAGFGSKGLHALFVTGDSGYRAEQLIPESDIKKGDPIITIMFYACNDANCIGESGEMYAVSPELWNTNETLQALKDVLTSLRVE